jgi:hypothetical protein
VIRAIPIAAALLVAAPAYAVAQPYVPGSPRAGSFEIGGGVAFTAGYDAGDRDALETRNGDAEGPPLTLYATSSSMRAGIGADARLGIYLTPRISAEGHFQFSRASLETRITDDFEGADPETAAMTVTSYLAGGTMLFHFGTGRFAPFVSGGGSYLRHLHEDNVVVETGGEFHAGGGVKFRLANGGRGLALRVDAQLSSRKGVGFEDTRRVLPSLGAGLTYVF